ncbi:MAG TPA: PAS domain S-box protein [Vicinamibacterales bacterium]|nr:PAS domain S-box protein [Vicinamibacterales bacterium]
MSHEPVHKPSQTDLFYDAFRASPIGIALEDMDGQPLFVNPALCSMLGFSEQEMQGKHCVDFSPPDDAAKDWTLFQQLRAGHIDHYHLDKRYFRKDGSLVWGRLSVSLLNSGPSPVVIAMVEDITEMRLAQDELRQSEATLQKLSGRLIEAQEQERRHIAREIHDDISQRLALLANGLYQLARNSSEPDARVLLQLEPLLTHVSDIAQALHALSHRLHSSKLETLGLVPAMRGFCREFAEQHNIGVDFTSFEVPGELSRYTSVCLFRILQEGLSNAAKHSGATQVDVRLEGVSGSLQLSIRDSGVGFNPGMAMRGSGIGLMSMKERVGLLKGTIVIMSKPNGGTQIQVAVPIASHADVDRLNATT